MNHNFKFFKRVLKIFYTFILLNHGILFAQINFTGKVIDVNSNPLSFVVVKNVTNNTGTITNDSGYFKIAAENGHLIEFEKLGFGLQSFLYNGQTNLEVILKSSENLLDVIVISASKGDQALKNTSVSMEIIKPYLIENKNPATAENVVDQIPGVQAIDGQVVIRSGSGWSYGAGSRVMVMLDGMPMLSADAGSVQWSFLPVENIENIEVIKGASSVLFGSSALNGIINIKTSKPSVKPVTKVSTFYGFYSKPKDNNLDWNGGNLLSVYGIRAFHSQKINLKNALTVSLNGYKDDGYRMGDAEERLRFGFQYRRELLNFSFFKAHCGLNGNLQNGNSSSFLLWENDRLAYTALDSNFTTNNSFRLNIDPYLVIDSRKINGLHHMVQGRFFRINNQIKDHTAGSSNQSNSSNAWYGEYQISKAFKFQLKLIGGITANYAISESPLYQGHQTSKNKAIYIQANQKLTKWTFDLGVRYESYKLNDYKESKPVIRAGLSRELRKATFVRASFGQGYRFPTIAESYISTAVGPVNIYPNPNLKSEMGWNAEVGLKQGLKFKKIIAILDLAAFWMEYDRMMEFTFAQWEKNSPTYGFGFKSLNVSNAQIKGLDLTFSGAKKSIHSELKWLLGYTISHAIATKPNEVFYKDSFNKDFDLSFKTTSSNPEGNFLKYRPKHLARIDVQYDLKKWEIGISGRYNSYLQNIDTAFVSFPISYAVPGIQSMRDKGKMGDYIIDFRLGKTFKNVSIRLIINNVLNRKYMTRPCDIGAPRSYMVQLNWKI
jgi:outer membrane receptor for ferrienterochelin and colicins